MSEINAWHFNSDRWKRKDIDTLRQSIEPTRSLENRSALIIGSGFMPFLLGVVAPKYITFVDYHESVVQGVSSRIDAIQHAQSWNEYIEQMRSRLEPTPSHFTAFEAEVHTASHLGLLHQSYGAVRSLAQEVHISLVAGDITDHATANKVAGSLDGTTPVFVNLTNVATHIAEGNNIWQRRRNLPGAWQQTAQFMDSAGVPPGAVVVDSDDGLVRPHVFTRETYRV